MRLVMLIMFFVGSIAYSTEDHGLGKIKTEELDLSYIDHVLTGRVGDRPIFAKPLEDSFGLTLWHRANGQDYETTLKVVDDRVVGEVLSQSTRGESVEESFEITTTDPAGALIIGRIGERDFVVRITADAMEGNHYVEPTFHIKIHGKSSYSFQLENSQACMGCAIKLTYVIVSMLFSYGAI